MCSIMLAVEAMRQSDVLKVGGQVKLDVDDFVVEIDVLALYDDTNDENEVTAALISFPTSILNKCGCSTANIKASQLWLHSLNLTCDIAVQIQNETPDGYWFCHTSRIFIINDGSHSDGYNVCFFVMFKL